MIQQRLRVIEFDTYLRINSKQQKKLAEIACIPEFRKCTKMNKIFYIQISCAFLSPKVTPSLSRMTDVQGGRRRRGRGGGEKKVTGWATKAGIFPHDKGKKAKKFSFFSRQTPTLSLKNRVGSRVMPRNFHFLKKENPSNCCRMPRRFMRENR